VEGGGIDVFGLSILRSDSAGSIRGRSKNAFWVASAATSLIFLLIGALKSRWSIQPWWQSGLVTLSVGGGAAAVAYAIGAWLRNLTG
jgi:VIT1/CCC1 family predicted Fe2+/Mn2+ transporter